ncbi:hypothetical protein [Deinococcus budaensis]|uniref:Uncharacterized protein n=1 Tax=Deinococcus budaensis TaxID=1665626 RepID=A0A7W8GH34_9DEIO|nr:hypothetical protein [Deinococcus budaensis]MBB5235526.1 hypothetical protein [Deinococcus budaensis]
MQLSEAEQGALMEVGDFGAVTAGRLTEQLGTRTPWRRLVTAGLLKACRTQRLGVVLGLTDRGARAYTELSGEPAPYVRAPGSLTDRAFQVEALSALKAEGYRLVQADRKLGGGVRGGAPTDLFVRFHLRVPEAQMEALEAYWGEGRPFGKGETYQAVLGHPVLYASLSGNGIQVSGARKLLSQHAGHITEWRYPLLIAVPEETREMRAYLRRVEAEDRARWGRYAASRTRADQPYIPPVRLLVVSPPQ